MWVCIWFEVEDFFVDVVVLVVVAWSRSQYAPICRGAGYYSCFTLRWLSAAVVLSLSLAHYHCVRRTNRRLPLTDIFQCARQIVAFCASVAQISWVFLRLPRASCVVVVCLWLCVPLLILALWTAIYRTLMPMPMPCCCCWRSANSISSRYLQWNLDLMCHPHSHNTFWPIPFGAKHQMISEIKDCSSGSGRKFLVTQAAGRTEDSLFRDSTVPQWI